MIRLLLLLEWLLLLSTVSTAINGFYIQTKLGNKSLSCCVRDPQDHPQVWWLTRRIQDTAHCCIHDNSLLYERRQNKIEKQKRVNSAKFWGNPALAHNGPEQLSPWGPPECIYFTHQWSQKTPVKKCLPMNLLETQWQGLYWGDGGAVHTGTFCLPCGKILDSQKESIQVCSAYIILFVLTQIV